MLLWIKTFHASYAYPYFLDVVLVAHSHQENEHSLQRVDDVWQQPESEESISKGIQLLNKLLRDPKKLQANLVHTYMVSLEYS